MDRRAREPRASRCAPRARSALLVLVVLIVGGGALAAAPAAAEEAPAPTLEVFERSDCPHCARAEAFLAELAARRPTLRIQRHDVGREPEALARLRALAEAAGVPPGVPAFHAGGRLLIGFEDAATTGVALERLLGEGDATRADEGAAVRIPLVGTVRPGEIGLPAFALALGLLDGFNPCAMWVLLFLLSLLVHLGSRRRMLVVGGTFVAVSGAVYFAFLAAWLNAFLWLGLARGVQTGLGLAAIAMGSIHLKDAVAPGRGPSLHIPRAAKPGIYARIRRVLHAEDLGAALGAVAVLALFVNVVELLCTAGLPALFTRVLTLRELPAWQYYAYLGLYVAAYVLDDALVLAVAVATLGRRRLRPGEGRALTGLSGALLAALGLVLVLRPGWLAAPGGWPAP